GRTLQPRREGAPGPVGGWPSTDQKEGQMMQKSTAVIVFAAFGLLACDSRNTAQRSASVKEREPSEGAQDDSNQVLEWNQMFVDTLIATNTANAASQRLGAIVHAAIFDAY